MESGRAPQKIIFVLIDGLADISLSEINDDTPLSHAATPAMDRIASAGLNGLMDPVSPGYACGSDTAHMSILGYNPFIHYRGRGSFEAMGAGLLMEKGDVAFKCNFATVETVDGQRVVTRRRVDRDFQQWGIELCSFLDQQPLKDFPNVCISTKYATEHRCGIVFKGPGLCDRIAGTDPLKDNLPLRRSEALDDSPEAIYSSQVLNTASDVFHERLSTHPLNIERVRKGLPPANVVLLRGPGERIDVPTFEDTHGLKSFMIAPTCIIAGLGASLGMNLVHAPNATGDYHSDLNSKAKTALAELTKGDRSYDFAFVHVKAVDDAGHDCSLGKKVRLIEKCDEMIHLLLEGLQEYVQDSIIVVTGDHTTPVDYGDHTFEPVPFTIAHVPLVASSKASTKDRNRAQFGSQVCDDVNQFSELAAARGALGRFSGDQVMSLIKHYSGNSSGK
uniref:2 putative n=1 Tax=Albugo laibachii Nc14 TaxID=890382 RepID=F0VZD9_9STRA|nr:2 putative [Albugo laibachii Nc14]|eukprot:CCA14169.1 2 putative [Albugo laibachii Nc14]